MASNYSASFSLPKNVMEAIEEVAEGIQISKSQVVAICVANQLGLTEWQLEFKEKEEGKTELMKLLSTIGKKK